MNPIDALFRRLRAETRAAFIPFLPAGDPDLAFTAEALQALATAGASLIEVGFPFSDPVADGPVIQASYNRALVGGMKPGGLFDTLRRVTTAAEWATPVVGMASYTLIHKRGLDQFLADATQAGLSGVVVPDLPVEEADEIAARAAERDFKLILLVTPTTPPERAERIVQASSGFVYVVSVVGITGERERLPEALPGQLQRLRQMTDLPLCVGFGVSTPAQVRELGQIADGVIVGTALVKHLAGADTPAGRATALAGLAEFACRLASV